MSVFLSVILDDTSLSELQKRIGTVEAAVPSKSSGKTYILSTKAMPSAPGYSRVEISVGVNVQEALRALGLADNSNDKEGDS
jgi:hypothetical protein